MKNAIETRIPEAAEQYNDPKEVDIYAHYAGKGIVALTERLFVQEVVKTFGTLKHLRVLDVGTGPGLIPLQLATKCPSWKLTALDASDLMLKKARTNWASAGVMIASVQAKAEATPFAENQFDLVYSHFAFHEFPEPSSVLKELKRVLKPGGLVLIQDLSRPRGGLFPVLVGLATVAYRSLDMGRQYRISLQASYRPEEMKAMMLEVGLERPLELRVPYGVGVLKLMAGKPQEQPAPLEGGEETIRFHSGAEAPSREVVDQIVEAGNLAPSGNNCQPWRYDWDGKKLWIHYLSERAESFLDTQQSAS